MQSEKLIKKRGRKRKLDFSDVIFCGVDYVSFLSYNLKGENSFVEFFIGLDDDNSNVRTVNFLGYEFDITSVKTNLGMGLIFSYNSETLFRIIYLDKAIKSFTKLDDEMLCFKIDFYGAFFALCRIGVFKMEFLRHFSESFIKFSRIDFAIDFKNLSVNDVAKRMSFTRNIKAKSAIGYLNGEHDTIYYGKKTCSNKLWLLRIYNKIKDSTVKKKERFYKDYFQYEKVTRFELEIRSNVFSNFHTNFDILFKKDDLFALLKSLLKTRYTNFNFDFTGFDFINKVDKVSNEALLDYFFPRFQSLYTHILDCGVSPDEIFALIKHLKPHKYAFENRLNRIKKISDSIRNFKSRGSQTVFWLEIKVMKSGEISI